MNQTLNKPRQPIFYIFAAFWSLLLLANFVPTIPQPEVIIGYLWKVEFALAAFLFIALVLFLKVSKDKILSFNRQEFLWIILPLLAFTAWSGISVFWAESQRDAVHHTLLWACYCVFYLLIRQIVSRPSRLNMSLSVTGIVVAIIGTVCLIEYFSTSYDLSGNVSLRYNKYAEAIATLFLLFAAISIGRKTRSAYFFGAIAIIGWLGIVFSLGRTQFLAALFAVFVFVGFALIRTGRGISLKKAAIFSCVFVTITIFSQISLFDQNSQQTTFKRLSGDEHSQMSFQVRMLTWQIALETFRQSPLVGVGAENFAANYETARLDLAESDPQNPNLNVYEEILPERAHNEFLQILSELGIVGIAFFGWFLLGIARLVFSIREKRATLLSVAALAGIFAFLLSSAASSYSFRVPANGLCFFFVLAIAVKSLEARVLRLESKKLFDLRLKTSDLKLALPALVICTAMLIFSTVRGVSLMYLQFAQTSADKIEAGEYFRKAIDFDSENAVLRYYYAQELYKNKRADEAIPQMRFAIDRGLATSISYFNLASAQTVAGKPLDAEKTFAEAIKAYPRSVFLRTSYAALLAENGKDAESEMEYKKALEINPQQAKSWRIARTEGMRKLSDAENGDKNLVKAMELRPTDAIYALLDFQRQFNPNLVRR
jgi:O-antigen ligase/Tfp pilus assembly protein PilF